jgi:hypothetical protein
MNICAIRNGEGFVFLVFSIRLFISKLFFALKCIYKYTTFTGTNIQIVHLQIQYIFKFDISAVVLAKRSKFSLTCFAASKILRVDLLS